MKTTNYLIATAMTAAIVSGQELPADMAAEAPEVPTHPSQPVPEVVQTPDDSTKAAVDSALSPGEQRIRVGLILLNSLYETMAGIKDKDTADAAVAPVMRIASELNTWAQSFTALPPMNETEQAMCEDAYLPIIRKLNAAIKTQGERLAAAEYYGSRHLPAALVKLALLNQ